MVAETRGHRRFFGEISVGIVAIWALLEFIEHFWGTFLAKSLAMSKLFTNFAPANRTGTKDDSGHHIYAAILCLVGVHCASLVQWSTQVGVSAQSLRRAFP